MYGRTKVEGGVMKIYVDNKLIATGKMLDYNNLESKMSSAGMIKKVEERIEELARKINIAEYAIVRTVSEKEEKRLREEIMTRRARVIENQRWLHVLREEGV